jgi:hypothetical protein
MLNIQERINGLVLLGKFMAQYEEKSDDESLSKLNEYFLDGYRAAIHEAHLFNNWFTPENLHFALREWSAALSRENLEAWKSRYAQSYFAPKEAKTVAIIMAGNIPLVGFHDLLSVIMSGHKALAKPSSDDDKLMPFLAQILVAIDKGFAEQIAFADGQIKDFDAVIATGSNNSARYFEHYFGKYPNIIRKNRTSVAVLHGDESTEDLKRFGEDIFRYFGLGCRNVSKAFVPKDFDTDRLFNAFYDFSHVVDNKKYGNNYDYNRAIYLMEKKDFLENGFFIIRESEDLHAPVAVLHLHRYHDMKTVEAELEKHAEELQCVVSEKKFDEHTVPMGETQRPRLWDYADKIDTLEFLQSLN